MRLTIFCGSFLLLAMANGGVVQEHSVATEEKKNSVPVKSEAITWSSEETSSEEYDPYNNAPSYPYQYYQYPPINPMLYPQYPQYYKPQKASKGHSKRTQGVPPQYPPQIPSYYPQVPPYQPQYPQYPPQYHQYPPQYPQYTPPASRYRPPYHQHGVNKPQADSENDVSDDEYCEK